MLLWVPSRLPCYFEHRPQLGPVQRVYLNLPVDHGEVLLRLGQRRGRLLAHQVGVLLELLPNPALEVPASERRERGTDVSPGRRERADADC